MLIYPYSHRPQAADNPSDTTAFPTVRIQGDRGEIAVYGPAYRPERFEFVLLAGSASTIERADVRMEIQGRGMYWQTDEAARCVRDGKN